MVMACVCVCIESQTACETWAAAYFVGISHVLGWVSVLSVSVCLCIHLLPVINSCHYGQWGRCKSASPGPSDGLWDPSACWYTQPLRRNRDEALTAYLLSIHRSCCLSGPVPIGYSPRFELPLVRVGLLTMQVRPPANLILIFNNGIGSGAW